MNSRQGGQVEACPVCETEAIDASIDSFDGVCTECGFVIHDSADPSAPDWLVVRNEETASGDEDWLVTCRVQNATEQRLAEAFEYLEDIADRLRYLPDFGVTPLISTVRRFSLRRPTEGTRTRWLLHASA
jgi:transcription initiation factor TFIIIB Brf1 subunit/transcription initiation factor TFIIB